MDMIKLNNLKRAFTLAEIIITLTIIGIVVVIMMQVLQPNVDAIRYKAQLNAAHALISRAIIQYQAENMCSGNLSICDEFVYENTDIEQIYHEMFDDKFKLEQRCGILVGQGCFTKGNYKYKNGDIFANPDDDANYYKIRLQNSISIAFSAPLPRCQDNVCMRIIVDTNGPQGPNIVNRDVYEGIVTTTQVKFNMEE